jgi:hypothetical protein
MKILTRMFLLIAATAITVGCVTYAATEDLIPIPTKVERITYHGWTNALRLVNERVEVVIVPRIGRVMSFRFLDGGENVFWEDRSLDGKEGNWNAKEWINFGGEKTWPAPEADWSKNTGRKDWRPPPAFDASPFEARIEKHELKGSEVVITSPMDPFYGIRVVRRASMWVNTLTIATSYERVQGEPIKVGVWTIAQFKEPVAVYAPIKTNSIFPAGYFKFDDKPWPFLEHKGDILKITRDPNVPHKMGNDTFRLLWVGEKESCSVTIVAPRPSGGEYPDRGASAEVYTNPNPKPYVELELLGPLSWMKAGDKITFTNRYSLWPRKWEDPDRTGRFHTR